MHLSFTFIWLALLQSQVVAYVDIPLSARQLRPRDYTSRDYYAIQLSETASPDLVAEHFGIEHEGPIGELANHHLFSTSIGDQDVVSGRIQEYHKNKKRHNLADRLYGSILFAEKQKLKRLVKRSIPPLPQVHQRLGRGDLLDLEDLMNILNIRDPIFHEQWHLVVLSEDSNCDMF